MPCRLKEGGAAPAALGKDAPYLRFGESAHPALAQLTGGGNPDAKFLQYMDLEVKPEGRVVLALSNGAPAVLEKSFGRGRVLLANTTAGVDWTYLPATIEFPILVHELVRYLVEHPDSEIAEVGSALERTPTWVRAKLDRLLVWNSNQILEVMLGFGARNVRVEYSADGTNWFLCGFSTAVTPSSGWPATLYVGMATTSANKTNYTRSQFSQYGDYAAPTNKQALLLVGWGANTPAGSPNGW
jgi:hypothetical protein